MGTGMQLEQILNKRKSCRAFLDRPIDPKLLRSIISKAAHAPSNGNLQPWQIYIVTGVALASLKQTTKQLVDDQVPLQTPEYQVYPKPLKDIYEQRRQEIGEDLYRVLGIPREDKQKRRGHYAKRDNRRTTYRCGVRHQNDVSHDRQRNEGGGHEPPQYGGNDEAHPKRWHSFKSKVAHGYRDRTDAGDTDQAF